MSLATFHLEVGPIGYTKLEINGEDVTSKVHGVEFQAQPGNATTLVLHERGATGVIEGEGIIRVASPAQIDPRAIVEFLGNIEPGALEAEVLSRSGFSDNPMVVALQVLMEWAGAGIHGSPATA